MFLLKYINKYVRSILHSLSVVSRGRGVGGGGRVLGLSVIGDLGDIAVVVVDVVVDVLDPAVGKSNGVRTLTLAGAIVGLSSVEVGVGVVVSYGVLVGVGGDLIGVHLDRGSVVGGGGSVGRGSMHHMVDGSGVDSVDKRSVHCVVSVADAVSDMGDMVDLGTGQTEEGGDHEGLKFGQ